MEKVTFKQFFTTLGAGIWQSICWFCNLCGYKDQSLYGLFVKRVFTGCVTILMMIMTGALLWALYSEHVMKPKYDYYDWQYVSRNVSYSQSAGKVENFKTGETIRNVDWIYKSVDGDSMVCFASKGKRGYFNKFTGKVVIKPQYKRAWIFSEGLACVEENDTLFFINHKNQKVIKANFVFDENADGYVFHDGICIVTVDNYKYGIINKQGKWLLKPEYEDVRNYKGKLWIVKKNKRLGVYDAYTQKMILPIRYRHVNIDSQGFVVEYEDYTMKRLNFDLTIKDNFVCSEINTVSYPSGKMDKNGEEILEPSRCLYYKTGSWMDKDSEKVGLMSPEGKPLTKPLYDNITGIGFDLYKAENAGNYIVINGKGQTVN